MHSSPHPRSPHQSILIERLKAEKNPISPGLILKIGPVVKQRFVFVCERERERACGCRGYSRTLCVCLSMAADVIWDAISKIFPGFECYCGPRQEVLFLSGAFTLYRSVPFVSDLGVTLPAGPALAQ